MTRFFFSILLALVAGGLLYAWLGDDPGYVLITVNNYAVETSFLLGMVFLLGGLALLFTVFRLLRGIYNFLSRRTGRHSPERSAERNLAALRSLAHGEGSLAYKGLMEEARHSRSPLLNYLGAALAAIIQGERAELRFSLQQADKLGDPDTLSLGLLKASVAFAEKQQEQALALLLDLHRRYPDNPTVLRMLIALCRELRDWAQLAALLPAIERVAVLDDAAFVRLRHELVLARLAAFQAEAGRQQLEAVMEILPREQRQSADILLHYVRHLRALGDHETAQAELIRFFRQHWDETLVREFGHIESSDPGQSLVVLEKLQQDHPGNSALALTLGRVSLRARQWEKAREYFEAAQIFSGDSLEQAEASAELGRLLERLGDNDRALICYRKAMGRLPGPLPALPYPGEE